MDCQTFKEWLAGDLDQEHAGPTPDHAQECAECRAWLAAARQLRAGLARMSPPTPPANLLPQIVSAWQAEVRAQRRLRRNRVVRTALALAAGLLVSVGGFALWQQSAETPPAAEPVVENQEPVQPSTPPAPVTTPEDFDEDRLLREAGSALVSLMSRTADEAVDQGKLLLPISTPMFDPGQSSPAEATTPPLTRAGQTVSVGLEPVTTSAKRAVNLFLRDYARMDF